MRKADIELKLRPIKIAFLVKANDKTSIIRSIELSSLLWGGMYNPIIPAYSTLPRKWAQNHDIYKYTGKQLMKGYVDAYDPDFILPIGETAENDYMWLGRQVIAENDIERKVAESGNVGYGVGIFEVLRGFFEEELKFVRRDPIDFKLLDLDEKDLLFLSSVFGNPPKAVNEAIKKYWPMDLGAGSVTVNLENFAHHITSFYVRKLLNYKIKQRGNFGWDRGECVFFLDATNGSDVIDYWNLRALGWAILPIPVQSLGSTEMRKHAVDFIDEYSGVSRNNKDIYYHCPVIWTGNVSEKAAKDFLTSLDIPPDEKSRGSRYILSHYPRIWDQWARGKDGSICCELDGGTASHELETEEGGVRVNTLDPKFASRFTEGQGPRFANDVTLSSLSYDDLYAEIIPEGGDNLSHAFSPVHVDEWRFSKRAASYLTSHKNWHIYIKIPKAEEVFVAWMNDNGFTIELSQPGKTAKQIIKLLGGKYGLSTLANEHLIALLRKMESGNETKPEEYWMRKEEFWGELSKIANSEELKIEPAKLLAAYIKAKIFQLGISVKCGTCSRTSWFDVESLMYTVQCKHCFEKFEIPSHSPNELVWSYRTIGPFNQPKRASGVIPSLLTLRVFTNLLDHELTTPMLSFETKIDGCLIEVDLGLFYRQRWNDPERGARLIFAECKGENSFKRDDIERMGKLAGKFPGAILVFSTLKEDLSPQEKKLLKPLVTRCRRYFKAEEPYNPVMILTKTELFARYDLTRTWEKKGGKYAKFGERLYYDNKLLGLCDTTQQIYLGMKPWQEWIMEQFEKRREQKRFRKELTKNQEASSDRSVNP